jgi:hypothetical protein
MFGVKYLKIFTYIMTTLPANDFDKISPTALLVAYIRQFSNIPYTQEIAIAKNEFDDLDHAERFAQEQGFQVESFSMSEVFDRLQCLSQLEIDPHRVRAILAATPVFALTLA